MASTGPKGHVTLFTQEGTAMAKARVPPTQAHGKPRAKSKKKKKASQSCGTERERNAEDIRQY